MVGSQVGMATLETSISSVAPWVLVLGCLILAVIGALVWRKRPHPARLDGTVTITSGPVEIAEFIVTGDRTDIPDNPFDVQGHVAPVPQSRRTAPQELSAVAVHVVYRGQESDCIVGDGETQYVDTFERRSYPLAVTYASRRSRMMSRIVN